MNSDEAELSRDCPECSIGELIPLTIIALRTVARSADLIKGSMPTGSSMATSPLLLPLDMSCQATSLTEIYGKKGSETVPIE